MPQSIYFHGVKWLPINGNTIASRNGRAMYVASESFTRFLEPMLVTQAGVERLAGPGLKDSYLPSWHGLIMSVSEGSYGCDF